MDNKIKTLYEKRQRAFEEFIKSDAEYQKALLDAQNKNSIDMEWVTQKEAAVLIHKSEQTISRNIGKGLYITKTPKGSKGCLIKRSSLFNDISGFEWE